VVTLLSKIFIKNPTDYQSPAVRRAYGTLCSAIGIFLNILMFAGKFLAGSIANSVAITADAFNNLSDAASSIITLLGFRLAGKEPNPNHPFGHGRIEYLSGVAVSILILLMGFELFKSSVLKIINPEPIEPSLLAGGIMVAAIIIKLYMAFYNKTVGKKIDSGAMAAVAADSLSDTISTIVVLASMIIAKFTGFNIDAYAGIFVAILILMTGFESVRDTISPLLGQAPSKEFVSDIERIVTSQEHVLAIHDLFVHDYGPGRLFVSVHAEVPGDVDVFVLHDEIDNAEVELKKQLGCNATIHLDPVCVNDDDVNKMRETVGAIVKKFDPVLSFHDFRMVPGETHTNLIFDVVVPTKYKMSHDELSNALKAEIEEHCFKCYAVIKVEQSYV